MTSPGTLETHFGRRYIFLNPDPSEGPGAWRLTNIPGIGSVDPDSNNLKDIYTLLPIGKTEAGTTINLLFDIDSLPDTRSVVNRKDYFRTTLSTFLSQAFVLPRMSGFGLVNLQGVAPVKTQVSGDVGIVYFDISDLPNLEDISRSRKYNILSSSFRYNSRSIDSLTATDPLFSKTAGETATVSFDISNLPDA